VKHASAGSAEQIATIVAAITALAVATPVLSIVLAALQPVPDLWPHLLNYVLPLALRDTALLLLGVGTLALLLGTATAWIISAYDFFGRKTLIWLMPLPLAIPTYLAAYVYVDLFEPLGLVHVTLSRWLESRDAVALLPQLRSLPGAICIIALVLYPYIYLSARAVFQWQNAELIEAGQVMGANRWMIFRRISLPMARPALAVGSALVSLETLNDIGASEYLGVRTLTVSIFTTWLNRGSLAGAAQLSCLMLALVAVLIAMERRARRTLSVEFSPESPRRSPRIQLAGAHGVLAVAACLLPVLFGFGVPLLFLIHQTVRRGLLHHYDSSLWRDALNSIGFAAAATLIALMLGLIAMLAHRWRRNAFTDIATGIAQTGYALPGLVLALGLLSPVLAIDNGVNTAARWLGLAPPGLLIMGSGAALVIAYAVRFLAIPIGFIKTGFERIPREYDDSAAVAGASLPGTSWRVHLPLLRPALLGATIVVFVDCLKELPATLLLRPLNVETLATSIYQYASRGSFEEGAAAALIIVAASIPPVILLTRLSDVPQGPV
jgi:iron(III) transport system permease protein